MNEAEFNEKINAADLELAAQGIPVHQRIFRAFNIIAPNYNGILLGFLAGQSQFSKYEGPRLLNEIEEWYQKIHGERSGLGEPIGHVPVVLRSDIYIANVPWVFGRPEIDVLGQIEGMNDHLRSLCTPEEIRQACMDWREGYELTYELATSRQDYLLPEPRKGALEQSKDLVESLFEDLKATRPALEASRAPGIALFHSQQLAEKSMKALLVSRGYTQSKIKGFQHKINRIFAECSEFLDDLDVKILCPDIGRMAAIKMDVRYAPPKISNRELADNFMSALRIGGAMSCALCRINRRDRLFRRSEIECAEPLRNQQINGLIRYK